MKRDGVGWLLVADDGRGWNGEKGWVLLLLRTNLCICWMMKLTLPSSGE